MTRQAKTCRQFANDLAACGARIKWTDEFSFRATTGRGAKSRTAYVYFYRDVDSFYRAAGYAPLRSMAAVRRYLNIQPGGAA